MDYLDRKSIEIHISVVAWLRILYSLFTMLAAGFVIAVMMTLGSVADDPVAFRILATLGWLTGGFLIVLSLPSLVAGIGLLLRAGWARVLAMVLSVLDLALFPVGTLLGCYNLFVLLQRSAEDSFGPKIEKAPKMQAATA